MRWFINRQGAAHVTELAEASRAAAAAPLALAAALLARRATARPSVQKASYPMLNVGMTIVFKPSRLVKRRSALNMRPFRRAFVSLRLING
jgi:hypothetical protein